MATVLKKKERESVKLKNVKFSAGSQQNLEVYFINYEKEDVTSFHGELKP